MTGHATENTTVEVDGTQFGTVREGLATILIPQGGKVGEDRGEVQQVFYNPIQQYNRDLSVLAIKAYGEEGLQGGGGLGVSYVCEVCICACREPNNAMGVSAGGDLRCPKARGAAYASARALP